MTGTIEATDASEAAQAAAARSGVEIRTIQEIADIESAMRLLRSVWGEESDLVGRATLKALAHAGNYVAIAVSDDSVVGAITGFLGWHDGEIQLHSHILGVSPATQGANIGFALKQHQRAWCVARGISTMTWTFDPLVRRNAYFNLTKLGASVTDYLVGFYGRMHDGINGDDESDRVLVEWKLESERAIAASVGRATVPSLESLLGSGAEVALDVGSDGRPERRTTSATSLLVGVPADIVEMRRTDPAGAAQWRSSTRDVISGLLNEGYDITAMTRDGYYLLSLVS